MFVLQTLKVLDLEDNWIDDVGVWYLNEILNSDVVSSFDIILLFI